MAESPIPIHTNRDGAVFRIRVIPRASRSEAVGIQGDALKLRITAAPVEGKANDECIGLLAKILGVKKTQVTIIAGHAAKNKTVAVSGIGPDALAGILYSITTRPETSDGRA